MPIKQITIELKNQPGELSKVSEILGREGVNIRSISSEDRGEIGVIRIVVDDHAKAFKILESHDLKIKARDVIAVETPDHPGGLSAILKPLKEASINVNILDTYLGRHGGNAILVLDVDQTEKAEGVLKRNWVHVFGDEVYSL